MGGGNIWRRMRQRKVVLGVGITVLFVLAIVLIGKKAQCGGAIPYISTRSEIMKFFKLDDGIDLMFAHAVNSVALLNESLDDSTVLVLEADVIMDPAKNIPIMAHPPATTSDLTLSELLNRVWSHSSPKGVKLDFKQIEVVEASLKILNDVRKRHQQGMLPVILNADVLVGPENPASMPVNATMFLELCQKYDRVSTLSPGWTTRAAKDQNNPKGYTWDMVREMNEAVKNIKQPITFPVRASLVGISKDQLLWLLNYREDYSLTVWHSKADKYDVSTMGFLRRAPYINKVYYDLPDAEIKELKRI